MNRDECLIYAGYKNPEGYGRMGFMGKTTGVHRIMYEAFVGEIPEKYEIDHLCEVKACINPDHLEAVTHQVNSHRGNFKRRSKYCRKGLHIMEGYNVLERDGIARRDRQCHQCNNERIARNRAVAKLSKQEKNGD